MPLIVKVVLQKSFCPTERLRDLDTSLLLIQCIVLVIYLVLTGAVLVVSVPSDGSHETDGGQDCYHPLETMVATTILTKWPISGKENKTVLLYDHSMVYMESSPTQFLVFIISDL